MTTRLSDQFDVSTEDLRGIVADALSNADDGELFIEHSKSEGFPQRSPETRHTILVR